MAVLIVLYLVVEVVAVWAVSSTIGFLPAIGLLLAGALLGTWLARREGARAIRAFTTTARAGKSPQAEITDGMLVALGGVLILLPGFVSDIFGFLLLLPPTRSTFRKFWLRKIDKHLRARATYGPGQRHEHVMVVDGEIVDPSSPAPGVDKKPLIIDSPEQPGKL